MTIALELWTDGSGTREDAGGWAFLLRAVDQDGEIVREREGYGGEFDTTSQRMEITAVLEGLRAIRKGDDTPLVITLYTDSKYVADMLAPLRLESCEANQWRAALGGSLKNVDLWLQVLAELRRGIKVIARHVKGHSGIEANEIVDRLAGDERRRLLDALGEQLTLVDQEGPTAVELVGPESALTGG